MGTALCRPQLHSQSITGRLARALLLCAYLFTSQGACYSLAPCNGMHDKPCYDSLKRGYELSHFHILCLMVPEDWQLTLSALRRGYLLCCPFKSLHFKHPSHTPLRHASASVWLPLLRIWHGSTLSWSGVRICARRWLCPRRLVAC